jgi:hypothetical protein
MNADFHYYATYCAAVIAGYSHAEAQKICYSAQLVDHCTKTLLSKLNAPLDAATTQLQSELIDARTDIIGLQDITRIWASFHFLPRDLYAEKKHASRLYRNKYRLICGPNGDLLKKTVELAKGNTLQAAGIAMHVLADTWAHTYFAGTPSLVINNTDSNFYELIPDGKKYKRRPIVFGHNPAAKENPDTGTYTASLYQSSENSIMNLGHGRAGHLPDYSFICYIYTPAWGDYEEIIKNNPDDYMHAFAQMIYALQYLRGVIPSFETDAYAWDAVEPYEQAIEDLLAVRRTDDSDDWKALGESITGEAIRPFSLEEYQQEYTAASEEKKTETYLGAFFKAAVAQKRMVTGEIAKSGNWLAGRVRTKKKLFQRFREDKS